MTSGWIAAAVVAALSLAGAAALAARLALRKHRAIWREIFGVRAALRDVDRQLVLLRKQLLAATVPGLRLPPLLPSQNGEEILLWNFFGRRRSGFYVDVGAHDGRDLSNTYFLEAAGWEGVLVEPNPRLFAGISGRRPHSRCVQAAVGDRPGDKTATLWCVSGEGGLDTLSYTVTGDEHQQRISKSGGSVEQVEVPAATLAALLEDVRVPIDLISIDVEGAEMEVLRGLDFSRHAPRVFLVEDNSRGRDREMTDFLWRQGYVERFRVGENVLLTRRDDPGVFSWEPDGPGSPGS